MIVSTKGRYALRVMLCFAQRGGEEYIPIKEIAEKEGISLKYLESIMTVLSKGGLVDAVHGKGGGYRLNRRPEDYTVQHSQADRRGSHRRVLHLGRARCLLPQLLL